MLNQTANQYKKMIEKVEIFSFQLEVVGRRYHHVLYLRFGKPTGILIVDENGGVIPLQEAQSIVAPMNYYNNIAKGATTDLVREKNRDMTPMIDLQQYLKRHSAQFSSLEEDYQNVIIMLETILEGQKDLHRIFEELKEIDVNSRERRGLVTLQDVQKFISLNEQYQSVLYRQGRVQQDYQDSIRPLASHMKENRSIFRENRRALEIVSSFLESRVTRTLDDSLKTFEQGVDGKRVHFASGEEGIVQMLELYRQKTQVETEQTLYQLLRNP